MRYVEYIRPLPDRAVEMDEPGAVAAIQPAKRVIPRSMPPLLLQPRRTSLQAEREETATPHGERRAAEEEEERRKQCRRVSHEPVTLDTRSGHDRRGEARREGDHLDASVDIKA